MLGNVRGFSYLCIGETIKGYDVLQFYHPAGGCLHHCRHPRPCVGNGQTEAETAEAEEVQVKGKKFHHLSRIHVLLLTLALLKV